MWVDSRVRPGRADNGAVEGAGELPLVLVAEGLPDGVSDLETGWALLKAVAAVVERSLVPQLEGRVGPKLLGGDGVDGGVATDANELEVRRIVAGVPAPKIEGARVPASLSDPVDSPRNGAVGVCLQRFGAGGPMDFDPGFAEDGAGVVGGLSE